MYELKRISKQAIPAALDRAEQYRLLNEPRQAESICRDILAADPENEPAAILLLLSLTDQFGKVGRTHLQHAEDVLHQIHDDYKRVYYGGVISERWAKAQLESDVPGHVVYQWFHRAMHLYEQAKSLAEPDNDEAILRWNTCARILNDNERIRPRAEDGEMHAGFEEEVPFR